MSKDKTQLLLENKKVFEETLNEFSSKPYELASVNEIIKRSHYNKGSFYYRFKDKYELYVSILDYVFVQQIDLFNKTSFDLTTNNHINAILHALFNNLLNLYKLDSRFYHLVIRFYNEKTDFVSSTLEVSVPSLYERFIKKLNHIGSFNDSQMIIIESIYKNLPIEKLLNQDIRLEEMINQLSNDKYKNDKIEIDSEDKYLDLHHFKDKFNYFITDNDFNNSLNEVFIVNDFLFEESKIKRLIKRKTFQLKFDVRRILKKYINKPIFNGIFLKNILESEDYVNIVKDDTLRNIFYTLIYGIIDLNEILVINHMISDLNDKQRDILFNKILPINGQLTKILIIDKVLVFNGCLNSFYMKDDLTGVKKYHMNDLSVQYQNKYYIKYIIDGVYSSDYFDSIDGFVKNHTNSEIKILEVKTVHELAYHQIKELVNKI
ncbi:TetR/AcrR family transcriptional regulator [Hujiaoplasma nucleasis]|uniref:TetR/AcrR family transcriptional regulator n=1 Tax=Hujiaoplasma nucleasis TaxID=2725268 RepID=A0A7L6N348_9MOLU|nr:TetR/AcrR family transcriptional regulator [Hujiaoplasma nucleasis]QLY39657.1 TetR/AcrR family transcriptional regulator [Hujiaoplasma nucleasis]